MLSSFYTLNLAFVQLKLPLVDSEYQFNIVNSLFFKVLEAAAVAQVEQVAAVDPPQQQILAVVKEEAAVEAPQAPAANVGVDQEGNAVVVEPIAVPGLAPLVPLAPMVAIPPQILGNPQLVNWLLNVLQPQQVQGAFRSPPVNAQSQLSEGRGARFRHCKRLIEESLDRREALGSAILQNARAKEEELVAVGLDVFDDCQDVVQLVQISRAALDVALDVEGEGAQQAQQENGAANN
ncbi:hypothetical protein B9Z55_007503 [Caenorhabditis nigoni]|uniref:Uncharacterized protein n=1 Tax=Caenorhabditis nigoni TaxID=1611254 RepID=A0A2G5VA16_9PELO|nr:hypothetical protein B9Z55_007503 [Caenorhabditis nigoni]